MANKDLLINIGARDAGSAVFVKLGGTVMETAQTIERAGQRGGRALDGLEDAMDDAGDSAVDMIHYIDLTADALGRDLPQGAGRGEQALEQLDRAQDEVGQSATEMGREVESSSRSLRDFGDAGQQVGAGLALLGGSFAMYAEQARDNEMAVAALRRTYGDAADSFMALANSMQSTTVFSNDQVLEAANIMGTLKRNYELTDQQIQQLITTSADLAAVNGTTLSDAAQRVAAAIRGEAESAEMLGLTMNQSAIDADNLTLSMSNAEAGAFRYNALMDQAAFATGAAGEQAQTATGQVQQLANRVQDAATGFVQWTGPIGDVAAGLSSFGLEAGLALTGMVQLARGARTAVAAMGGLSAIAGPAGIALALGGAALAAYKFASSLGDDLDVKLRQTQQSAATLDETVAILTATMNDASLALTIGQGDAAIDRLREEAEYYKYLVDTYADLPTDRLFLDTSNMDAETQASIEQHRQALAYIEQYEQRFGDAAAALDLAKEAQNDYNTILSHHGPGARLALEATAALIDQWQDGIITTDELVAGFDEISNNLGTYDEQAREAAAAAEEFAAAQAELRQEINLTTVAIGEYLEKLNPSRSSAQQFIENAYEIERAIGLIERAMTDANETPQFELTGGMEALETLEQQLLDIQTNTAAGAGMVRLMVDELTEDFLMGNMTADAYANKIQEITDRLPEFAAQAAILRWEMEHSSATAEEFAAATGLTAAALDEAQAGMVKAGQSADQAATQLDHFWDIVREGYRVHLPALLDALSEWESRDLTFRFNIETDEADARGKIRPTADALYETGEAAETAQRSLGDYSLQVGELGALVAAQALPWAAYQQALAGVAAEFGLLTTNAQQFQAVGLGGQSVDVAVNLQTGGGDLDRIFNTIVGQTNQMSQQMGSVESWADKLIGDPGTWSQLDDLLAQGRISIEQYNEAQAAQVRISTDVENAQWDLLAVQANLAPVIADATRRQAEYIDGLQDLDTNAQLAALGFMDQAQSARALEIAQLAAASSTEAQRDATTDMITEMVNADPVLGAMLEKMGLISYGAKGEIIVNFGEAESATSAIEDLNGSIEVLIALLGDIFNVETETNAPATTLLIEALTGSVNEIPDKVTTTVNLIDNASGPIAALAFSMDMLNGKTVDTYVTTHYQTTGVKAPGITAATGTTIPFDAQPVLAGVPRFAGGGTMALVGEFGPELVTLPTGSQVTNAVATETRRGQTRQGTGGIHFHGPVTLNPAGRDAFESISGAAIRRGRR